MQVTYAEVAEHALGSTGRSVVEVQLVLSQSAFCAAYIIFIYETLPSVSSAISPWAVILTIVPLQVCPCTRQAITCQVISMSSADEQLPHDRSSCGSGPQPASMFRC
jgi:amino acid permease